MHGKQVSRGATVPGLLWHHGRWPLALAVLYACADFGLNRFGFGEGWKILWPLNGVTVALLLMRPRSEWPLILISLEIGTGWGEWLDGNSVGLAIAMRLISASEVYLTASMLPPFKNLDDWFRRHTFAMFVAALIIGPSVSGVFAAILFHLSEHQPYLAGFNEWATADALGIASIMPLALALRSTEMRALFSRNALGKTLLVLGGALAVCACALSSSQYPLLWLIFPTLLAVDLILSFSGAAIAGAALCFLSIYATTHSFGLFGLWNNDLFVSRNVAVQCFLGFQLLALFPASIILRERRSLIADLNSSNQQLLMLASLDGLTGIANRRALNLTFCQEWKRATRLGSPLAMMMVDVDLFKGFNDRYGHSAGDDCLRAVAQALTKIARRPQDTVARFGGEEFALLLPHTEEAAALHLAERVRAEVQALAIKHGGSEWGSVTVSIGCAALTPTLESSESELLQLADQALYAAKRAGRNRVQGCQRGPVAARESTS